MAGDGNEGRPLVSDDRGAERRNPVPAPCLVDAFEQLLLEGVHVESAAMSVAAMSMADESAASSGTTFSGRIAYTPRSG